MKDPQLREAPETLARVGEMMLSRNLADLSGGNISARVDDRILMSPALAGTRRFWHLDPAEVLALDLRGNNSMARESFLARRWPT